MPTKKQRRRREKLQRHEWEYVRETEEGEEIVEAPRAARAETRQAPKQRGPVDRRGRPIQKPSWRRVFKRTAIFFPAIVVVVFLLGGSQVTTAAKILNAVVLVAFFVPFSYLVDVMMYRAFQRRHEREQRREGR